MALFETLSDDFNDGVVEDHNDPSGRWPNGFGTVTESGGRCQILCGTNFSLLRSVNDFQLAGSSVFLRFFPAANNGATTSDTVRSIVQVTNGTLNSDGDFLTIELENGTDGNIEFAIEDSFSDFNATVEPYDPVNHAWIRFRESGGTTFLESSPDGSTWTTKRSAPNPSWVDTATDLDLRVAGHRDAGTTNSVEIDNVNVPQGGVDVAGSAVLSGGASLSVTARANVRAASRMAGASTLAATGSLDVRAAAQLAGIGTVTASGEVGHNVDIAVLVSATRVRGLVTVDTETRTRERIAVLATRAREPATVHTQIRPSTAVADIRAGTSTADTRKRGE